MKRLKKSLPVSALLSLAALLSMATTQGVDEKPKGELTREAEAAVQKGIDHLRNKGQTDEGAFCKTGIGDA